MQTCERQPHILRVRHTDEQMVNQAGWKTPLSRSAEFGIIAGFWVTVAVLTIAQEAFDPRFLGGDSWQVSLGYFTFFKYMIWVLLTPCIFWLIRSIGQLENGWMQLVLHGVLGATVSAIVHYGYHILWNYIMPSSPHSTSLLYVLSGLHFLPELFLYLVVLAAGFARDYFHRYRERMRETARLQAESADLRADAAELRAQLADARLQALHMQINPHFLFNTLHMISAYIERDAASTRRIITLLSELLRYGLEKSDQVEVPLARELDFLNKYLEIQSIRFQGRLEVHRNIDPHSRDALVPGFILQPLVENAIKHGVSAIDGIGRIEINVWQDKRLLHVTIQDNGPGMAGFSGDGAPGSRPGIGIKNTRKRLATRYQKEQGLILRNAPEGGAVAHLTLPYHTQHDLKTTVVQV